MTAKRFTCKIDERDGHLVDVWYDNGKPIYSGSKVCDLLNDFSEENEQLKIFLEALKEELSLANRDNDTLEKENEQLKQQIKDLRISVLDSIHEADEIKCTCNPCVVEECVKRVVL